MTGIMDYIDIARQIIEERLYGIRPGDLAAVSAKISNNYHSSNKTSQRLISDELQAPGICRGKNAGDICGSQECIGKISDVQ